VIAVVWCSDQLGTCTSKTNVRECVYIYTNASIYIQREREKERERIRERERDRERHHLNTLIKLHVRDQCV